MDALPKRLPGDTVPAMSPDLNKQTRHLIVAYYRRGADFRNGLTEITAFLAEYEPRLDIEVALKARRTMREVERQINQIEAVADLLFEHMQSLDEVEQMVEEFKGTLATAIPTEKGKSFNEG